MIPKPLHGYTIAEMIIVLAIFSFGMVAITSSILYFYRSNTYAVEQTSAIQSGRRGIEYFVRDVREATYSEDGAYPIEMLGTSTVTFYSDVDDVIDIEKIRYFLSSGNLMKGVTKASGIPLEYTGSESLSIVADYVRNLEKNVDVFEYRDEDGAVISDLNLNQDVRFINVKLIVNVNPNRLPEEFLIYGSASLRNLKEL